MQCGMILAVLFSFWSQITHATASEQCGLYLAPSSIPNAGLGVFAGHKSFKRHDLVVDGDLAVPLYDMPHQDAYPFLLQGTYTWESDDIFPHLLEEEDEVRYAVAFGVGAAINCMFGLNNVKGTVAASDNAGLHRSKDPGVGAFTPYHDRKIYADTDIPPGMELFTNGGEQYVIERADEFGHYIPFERHFVQADAVIQKFVNLTKNAILWTATEEKAESTRRFSALWNIIAGMKHGVGSESRLIHALPDSYSSVEHIAEIGTALTYYNRSIRSLEWLDEHGKCADNIRPGPSTIPQAGRGAFAAHFIPKGGLVAPAPLIQIPNRSILDIYEDDEKHEKVVHQQLLLNYCFGHANSSLLLVPYGIFTSLINHSSQRPNAKIQWSDSQTHAEWMNMSVTSLNDYYHTGLAFDFVALRDIDKNEEILIDYGSDWEEAWSNHIKTFVPARDSIRYQAGFELNEDLDSIFWPYDQFPYYSPNLTVWMHGIYLEYNSGTKASKQQVDNCMVRIVGHYFVRGQVLYNVEVIERILDNETHETREIFKHVVFGVPRDAILFEDKLYTRDHEVHSAFRHTMMIPDDMMPTAWKNLN